MNKFLLQFCFVFIAIVFVIPANPKLNLPLSKSISVRKLGIDYDYIYCQAGDHVVDRHVPRPDFSKILAKGGGTLGDFEVTYTGFTQEAREAFQFAVDIWDMLLDSEAKIRVNANFADLNSGVLGSASPTGFYANFSDKVDENIEYAAPLAEKIAGASLNGTAADLSCNFSSAANWFYDFNNTQNIASNEHDFVSVVLHELGHGLGFLSSYTFASTDRLGFIRGANPVITDIFSLLLEQGDGTNLLLNLEEASSELGIALTGGDIFLNNHSIIKGPLPEIFAPNPWNGGSSLSHLDEATFNPTDPLMTPSIGAMEVIHDPEIALVMMNDMGWRGSFIAHRAANVELVDEPFMVSADIFTDVGVGFDSSAVLLIYSQDSFRMTSDTIVLDVIDDSSAFQAEIPAGNETGRYQYYISLNDNINKGYSSPLLAPQRYHDVEIGIDNAAPEIDHTPTEFIFLNEGPPALSAKVTDSFTGVDTVIIEYRVNGGDLTERGLINLEFDLYKQTLDIESLRLRPGDVIEYRLKAIDKSMASNFSFDPLNGFYSMEIKGVPSEVEFYENEFEGSPVDFSFEGFSFRTESGFDNAGLHSEHPYQNAGTGNDFNFTAQLRVPIKVIEDGLIEFDEVVLVEPGESGSSFGADDFWDYVIVEVSENGGSTWTPLMDGYDSSDKTIWNNRYEAGLVGQNSTSSGDKALLVRRSIKLHQPALGIDIGDVVIVRWRLFSDAFAAGWGWVIDDLVIQEEQNTTPIVTYDASDDYISIFPNPIVEDYLNFTIVGDLSIRKMIISDSNGREILQEGGRVNYNDSNSLNISGLIPGVYFIVFQSDDISITKRFLKL